MRSLPPVHLLFPLISLLALAGCGGQSAAEHAAKGDAFVAQKKLAEATIEYRAALQADPNLGEVRLKLGNLYVQNQELAQALREYVRAADLLPQNAEAQLKAGNILLMAGQFQDAKARATRATEIDPKDADAQILLGNTLAGLKDVEGALAEYQKALLLSPTEEVAYRNIATLQFSQGQVTEAEAAFRRAVEVAPKSVPARLALANLLWATNRGPEAEQTLKDTLALDPQNDVANRALGTFYIGSNRVAEAEPYYQTIAKVAKTTEASLGLADYYIFAKRYEDARSTLKPLAANTDTYANATLRLAAIDVALGVRAEAEVKLRQMLETHPKEMAARLLLARLLVIDGKREEALTMGASIAKDDPNSSMAADAQALVGTVQVSLDRPEDAIAAFEDVLKRRPRTTGAELALGRLHLMQGNVDKADKYVSDALSTNPTNPAARAEHVRVLLARRNVSGAKQELESLKKEYPDSPQVLLLVGAQQLSENQVAAARATYARVSQLAPNDIDAFAALVRIDLSTGRKADALKRVDEGLAAMAKTGPLYVVAAEAYTAAGDAARAEALLKKAIDIEPARLRAYTLLGLLYVRQHRLDEAERNFKETVTRNPSSVSAGTMLGMLYEAKGKNAEAEQQYRLVLGLDSKAAVAANNLAWLYAASGRNVNEALELAKTAQLRLPDEPNVNDTLGWIYYRLGSYSQAITHLEASAAKDPKAPLTQYHLGMAYARYSEPDKARAALTKAVAAGQSFEGIQEARDTLATLPK